MWHTEELKLNPFIITIDSKLFSKCIYTCLSITLMSVHVHFCTICIYKFFKDFDEIWNTDVFWHKDELYWKQPHTTHHVMPYVEKSLYGKKLRILKFSNLAILI